MTQSQALDILKMGKNVFVTGPAGSGKTHLINQYIAYLKSHDVDVGITASTGIAATHLGGVTIHSWSGMGIKPDLSAYDLKALEEKSYLWKRFERVKVLIIDEISMLHHFRLDLVDKILRTMKRNNEPFGGIQVVLCGDFFQLPPVGKRDEPEAYFVYKADSWRDAGFTVCYLSEQFRQKDNACISILNEIRSGEVSDEARENLKSRYNKKTLKNAEPTRLFTHNVDVDSVNDAELGKIDSSVAAYKMESRGRDIIVEALKKSCLAPETLRLKKGARVMCVKNHPEGLYVNGTLGIVFSCNSNSDPVIQTVVGKFITIEKASWKIEEDGKIKAEIIQYPIRLAWAITVHKSQGMSLDAVEVDLSKSFEPGMGYVALSRVRTLEGLTILGLNEMALSVHPEVLEFDHDLREASRKAQGRLESMEKNEVSECQEEFLGRIKPKLKDKKISTFEKTAILIRERKPLKKIAEERGVNAETIISHLEKFLEEGIKIDFSYLRHEISPTHFKKIKKALEEVVAKNGEAKLSPLKSKLGASISFAEIRLVRALLGYSKTS